MGTSLAADDEHEIFPPTVWSCSFASFSFQHSVFESYCKEVETVKEKVKDLLMQFTKEPAENIEFINLLCRLGVSYHFESEISKQLADIFISLPYILEDKDYDLYTISLLFRILRQHGYKMSCDVFKKFKDINGEFKESITKDVKGLLSLYEASFLRVHGDYILDEASVFTRQQLETAALDQSLAAHIAKHIRNALFLPSHRNLERIETQQFIIFYQEEESPNETLLKFAKLDFNRLQLLYKQELAEVSRWWKDLNLLESLPNVRDRIVECYVWALGMHFEPQFALSRILTTKYTALETVMDDLYDSFAKIDDLKQFTAAMQRGTIDAIDQLPEYMKCVYKAILNLFNETEDDVVGNEEKSSRTFYVKEQYKELVPCLLREQKWFIDGHTPTFDEYMRTALITISLGVYPASSLIGMENIVGIEEFEWIQNNTKFDHSIKLLCRLLDDIEDDEENGVRASCIKCYMKEYGVTQKQAMEEIQKMYENTWKDFNEECMNPTTISKSRTLVKYYVNYARIVCFIYRHGDSFTNPQRVKDKFSSLFLEPFVL